MDGTAASTRGSARQIAARIVSVGLALAALWLIAFHAALFFQRLSDSSLSRPGVAVRWGVSVLLIAGLLVLQRFATRRVAARSRHAVIVFWLLVALLHVGTSADDRLLTSANGFTTLTQIGLAALPAVLLLLALFVSDPPRSRGFSKANSPQIRSASIRSASCSIPRSPPAL